MLILYARGYRFDAGQRRFVPTGALYVRSQPVGASISIDGVRRGQTAGWLGEAVAKPGLVANLLPGEYTVRVELPGYLPWIKRLAVFPRRVTEARRILLFPERRRSSFLSHASVREALPMPGQDRLVIATSTASRERVEVMAFDGREPNLIFEQPAVGSSLALDSISPQNKSLFFWQRTATGVLASIVSLADARPRVRRLALHAGITPDRTVHRGGRGMPGGRWEGDERVALRDGDSLLLWDASAGTVRKLGTAVRGFAAVPDGWLLLAGSPPSLLRFSSAGPAPLTLSTVPLSDDIREAWLYRLGAERYGVLARLESPSGGRLYLVGRDAPPVELDHEVQSLDVSRDGKKLLIRKTHELWVHYLDDDMGADPPRRGGERQLLMRLAAAVREARWHPLSDYSVLYVDDEGLWVTELDDRGGSRNSVELVHDRELELIGATRTHVVFRSRGRLTKISWTAE